MQDFSEQGWPRTTLLGRLSPPARTAMLEAGVRAEQPGGRVILRQGEPGSHIYLLLSGIVKVVVSTADGQDTLLGVRFAGDIVGEMATLEGGKRTANVITCASLVVRVIQREQLDDLMTRYPEIAVEIAKMISGRLRWANRRRVDFAHTPRIRVGRVLMEIARTYGSRHGSRWELGVPLTQPEIASLAGVRPRTVEKELHRLQAEGVIERRYRGIEITDMRRLEEIADEPEIPH